MTTGLPPRHVVDAASGALLDEVRPVDLVLLGAVALDDTIRGFRLGGDGLTSRDEVVVP